MSVTLLFVMVSKTYQKSGEDKLTVPAVVVAVAVLVAVAVELELSSWW